MWKCKRCNEEVDDNFDVCWNCETSKTGVLTKNPTASPTNASFKCQQCGLINDVIDGKECKRCGTLYNPDAPVPKTKNVAEHLVVPFASIQNMGGQTGQIAAKQLQDLINTHSLQGWEFYRMDTITYVENPGCLASLFGQKAVMGRVDVVIFRRSRVYSL